MNCMQPKLLCEHTFDSRPTLPATSRGSAIVDTEHAFGSSFAGQFTASGDMHAKVSKSSLWQLQHFYDRGVARNGNIFRQQQRGMS